MNLEFKTNRPLSAEDLDYAADCRAMLAGEKMGVANLLLWLTLIFFAAAGVWAHLSELDEVTRGVGKVIPSSSVQLIQSLEGGLLEELMVREGEAVAKGQPLLKIHDVIFTASYRENVAKRDVLTARMVRLEAEAANQKSLEFPEEIRTSRPDLVTTESELFARRRQDLDRALKTLGTSLKLAQKEYDMMLPKVGSGAVSEIEALRLEREINELTGEIENRTSQFERQALEALDVARAELASLLESIKGYSDRVERTEMNSPVNGTVNKIHINTVGGVIKAGEYIMEIVPSEDNLLVEAHIRPADIGFLRLGQEAMVKFTAYDFTRYGGLDGKVEHIGADTIQNERGESFYQIKVRTTQTTLGVDETGTPLPLMPGMVAEVDVLMGKKTVLEYLLTPINRATQRAFRER